MGLPLIYFAIAVALLALCVAATPNELFRLAVANSRRADGTRSDKRLGIEVRHFVDFLGTTVLAPLLAIVMLSVATVIVHEFVVPIPMVADIFAAFDANPEVWEAAIETGAAGDIGATYESWSADRGFGASTARFWQEFLWHHWGAVLVIAIVLTSAIVWYLTSYYTFASVRYGNGILRRRKEYVRVDGERFAEKEGLWR